MMFITTFHWAHSTCSDKQVYVGVRFVRVCEYAWSMRGVRMCGGRTGGLMCVVRGVRECGDEAGSRTWHTHVPHSKTLTYLCPISQHPVHANMP